jgi:replicative DNA helicase
VADGPDRSLPTNVDAERFILGSILLDDSLYPEVAAALSSDDYSLEKHRRIYRRMAGLAARSERIDRVTLANELLKFEELESCDGLSYIVSLDDGLPHTPNLGSYVRIVKEKAVLRRIVFAAQNMIGRAVQPGADSTEILSAASGQFLALAETQEPDELQNIGEVIEDEIVRVGVDQFFGGATGGIPTPIKWLNENIVGFQRGDLILVGARPSVGKTALAKQCLHHAAKRGFGCILFSLEMGKLPIAVQIACSSLNIDSQLFRTGHLSMDERRQILGVVEELKKLPLWIDKTSRTREAIHAKIRRAKARGLQIDLVGVDYIQLMDSEERYENANQRLTAISRGLKLTAEELDVAMLVLSQLSRPPKATNPEPQISDLRESGALEQDGDVIILLHSPDGNLGSGPRQILLKKQRNGPVGATTMSFVGKYQRFEEMEQAQEPEG